LLDKLDLRIEGDAPFTQSFGRLYSDSRGDRKRWKSSQHYAASASFEDCGLDAIVHIECTMTPKRMHKLEILRVGEKTLAECAEIASRIFEVEPDTHGVMRVDLTADVPGVPVDWFKRHTLARHKQIRRELGRMESYQNVSQGKSETIYHGKKPNQIRIYDKCAERRMQYGKYLARFAREHRIGQTVMRDEFANVNKASYWSTFEHSEMLAEATHLLKNVLDGTQATTFEAMYGHGMWDVITRVERQAGTTREIEKLGLSTLHSVRLRGDSIDPFDKMVFFDGENEDPRIEDFKFKDWCCGMELRRRVEMFGVAEVQRWMRTNLGSNFDRTRKTLAPFLRLKDNVVGISAEGLKQAYQASTYRQLLSAAA